MQALHWTTLREGNIEGSRYPGLSTYTMLLTWQLAFGLILGSVAVAVAIAFGVGGRDAAKRMLDRWTNTP